MQKSELETELGRVKAEETNLREALHKMRSLNDALNLDKDELTASVDKVRVDARNDKTLRLSHSLQIYNFSI